MGNRRLRIDPARVREVLNYDPDTGVFTWRIRTSNRVQVGDVAGADRKAGYREIKIDGMRCLSHVVAWAYMTGAWPEHSVDHRDGDKSNDRWRNLRAATSFQNAANVAPRQNLSGLKGVGWHPGSGLWHARINSHGVASYLGYFDCKAAAHFAYLVAASKTFGEFAWHHRPRGER